MSIPAQFKYLIFTILFTVATVNFVRTTMNVLQSSKRLENLKEEVVSLEEKRAYLEQTIDYKKTDEYAEERARNALNLIKPGEKLYVSSTVLGKASERVKEELENKEKSNIQLWYELFF
jgi:cell division protein FtsB